MPIKNRRKFEIDQTVITRAAADILTYKEISRALQRHQEGDWGQICEEDRLANEFALIHGERLMSVFSEGEIKYWIITEWDRSVTTVLMPDDY